MKCLVSFISLNKLNFSSNMDVFPFTRASQIQSWQREGDIQGTLIAGNFHIDFILLGIFGFVYGIISFVVFWFGFLFAMGFFPNAVVGPWGVLVLYLKSYQGFNKKKFSWAKILDWIFDPDPEMRNSLESSKLGAIKHAGTVNPRHLKLARHLVLEGPRSYPRFGYSYIPPPFDIKSPLWIPFFRGLLYAITKSP